MRTRTMKRSGMWTLWKRGVMDMEFVVRYVDYRPVRRKKRQISRRSRQANRKK